MSGTIIEKKSRDYHWSTAEVDSIQTDEIISKLREFGVDFEKRQFQEDVKRYYSAEELADSWKERYPISAVGFDLDFIWMACVVLWKRLAPGVINSEQLDEIMQRGYELLRKRDKDRTIEACELWLGVWEHLKHRFTDDMQSIKEAETVFSGIQFLHNWCQDLEEELGNAAFHDASFYEKRIDYCREFYTLFPKSNELLIVNMKRAEAESYFFLGKTEKGDNVFRALIDEFPDSIWGYIGWGDMYYIDNPSKTDENKAKAKAIYQMALKTNSEEKIYAMERIESLNEEQN